MNMQKLKLYFVTSIVIFGLFGVFLVLSKEKNTEIFSIEEKIAVVLDWFPNTNHTGLYVAQNHGYFAAEDLAVEIIQPGETGGLQLVAAGKADFAISSQEEVIQARAENIPVVSIAAVIQHNTSAFASLKESNITKVSDFEGKRYGGWGSPIEEAVLTAVMKDAGADYENIENITIGTTDFFTSIGKDTDFQWIFYAWDGIEAERRGIELNTIKLADLDPILDYYTPVIITNEQHVQEQKELVGRFMSAVSEGYDFAINNPDESAEILIKYAPELNNELVRQSQKWLSPQYQADSEKWGVQRVDVWENYAKWLYKKELIGKMISAEESFTNEFLPSKE